MSLFYQIRFAPTSPQRTKEKSLSREIGKTDTAPPFDRATTHGEAGVDPEQLEREVEREIGERKPVLVRQGEDERADGRRAELAAVLAVGGQDVQFDPGATWKN